MRKSKHDIKAQIIKSIDAYRENDKIYFLDEPNKVNISEGINLAENELGVVFFDIGSTNWILVSTERIFYNLNDEIMYAFGTEIIDLKFENQITGDNEHTMRKCQNVSEYKRWLFSGNMILELQDGSKKSIHVPNHNIGFCLSGIFKKLKFVSGKYEAY